MPFDKLAWQKAYDQKRRQNPEFRAREAAYKQKRRLDPEFRKRAAEMNRLWREQNPRYGRLWFKRNPGRQKAYVQKRYQDPEFWARRAAYMARRRKNDPAYRILVNCRRRLLHALRGRGTKSARTLELLGCSPRQLKLHLEAQFKSEMTWENYGTYWQIDHIFPCARFDLSCPIQQRQCFHFSNLQPLEAMENLLKRDN